MALTISETLLDGNGIAVSGAQIYCSASVRPLWVNQGSGQWLVADAGSYAIATTNASGLWSLTLPWPDHCDPASVTFTVTMPDGSQLAGKVPQGVSGPLTLKNLKDGYGWGIPSPAPGSAVVATISAPSGPYFLADSYGARGDGATDDTAAINNAVLGAYAAGGGTVLLRSATYVASQVVLYNRVWLRGMGMHATTVLQKASASGDLVVNHVSSNGTTDPNAEFCAVLDLTLDGNKANQAQPTNGINFSTNPLNTQASGDDDFDTHQLVQNVFIRNFKGSGFVATGRGEHRLFNVHAYNCDKYGFSPTYDSALVGCVAGQSGLEGFFLNTGNVRLSACKSFISGRITASSGYGYHITNIAGFAGCVTLSSCEAQDNAASGFLIDTSNRCTLAGCTADSNSTSLAGGYPAFDLYAAQYCRLVGCIAVDRSPAGTQNQQYALQVRNGSAQNHVDVTHSYSQGSTQPSVAVKPGSTVTNNDMRVNAQSGCDVATVAAGGTYTPDPYGKGGTALLTLSGTVTIANPASGHVGCQLLLVLIDTAAHAVTWGTQYVGTKPSSSAAGRTIVSLVSDGTSWNVVGSASS